MSTLEFNTSTSDIASDEELMVLEKLLSENDEKNPKLPAAEKPLAPAAPRLREDSSFADAFSYEVDLPNCNIASDAAKLEDLDSSDDEGVKNFLERKYNEYGSDINKRLKQQRAAQHEQQVVKDVNSALATTAKQEVTASTSQTAQAFDIHIRNPYQPIKRQSQVSASFNRPALPQARQTATTSPSAAAPSKPVFTDPVFGLRIINPLISSTLLVERMAGRKPVPFASIAFHTQRGDLSKDWVIAGALVHKAPIRTSKKGDPYSIWQLSDLRGDIKTVSLFVFGGAHKELWKTAEGMCLAILNPSIFEKRAERGDVACLSIDTAQKVMILGQSKDFGICKALKKNGEKCTAVVNLSECEHCLFHMKQEYSKMSKRPDLQSAHMGRGLVDLRNKVLGKSEVFYGGQSFSAIPAKKPVKLMAKDAKRMSTLSEYAVSPLAASINHKPTPKNKPITYAARGGPTSRVAEDIGLTAKQRLKDLERLRILQMEDEQIEAITEKNTTIATNGVTVEKPLAYTSNKESIEDDKPTTSMLKSKELHETIAKKKTAVLPVANQLNGNSKSKQPEANSEEKSNKLNGFTSPDGASSSATARSSLENLVPEKFKNRSFSFATRSPQLSRENFCIEVNISERQAQLSKFKATQILKQRPIEKVNPNSTRGSREGKRRAIDELNEKFQSEEFKRQKLDEEQREKDRKSRLQRIMDATSSHTNLVDMRESEEQEKYFNKLEKKEALEEKMLGTYKVPCKAVICLQCKYTAFSAGERCKQERHTLKVVDALKRFFQCKDCGNRTVTVFKLPKLSCSNCHSSNWQRAAMIREKKICTGVEELSVRGNEETFLGSLSSKVNLNLLVPDEE